MTERITIAAQIGGHTFVRRGSPVISLDPFSETDLHLVVNNISPDGSEVYVLTHACYDGECAQWEKTTKFLLDLESATGRAHLAWWIAEHIGAAAPTRCVFGRSISLMRGSGWSIARAGSGSFRWWLTTELWLSHLDKDDPRLLDDGSRWVDAMALKLVAEHVAGGAG